MKKLLFYYPQHFNRTKEGTNPFFDRMLEVCDREGIAYDLMEEPDGGTDKPRNIKAKKADIFFWCVTAVRKLFSILLPKKSFFTREKYVANVVNLFTLGYYRRPVYITISGSMFHLFSNLNPKAKVFDLQHGVVYSGQKTFFDDQGKLRSQFFSTNLHFLFWGKGYEDSFVSGNEIELAGKTHSVGYPIKSVVRDKDKADDGLPQILVSLQFTHDAPIETRLRDKEILTQFLEKVHGAGFKILLKHHPRFNGSINIDDILENYDDVELTQDSLSELVKRVKLHVTFFSTAAFEYAEYGIPTYFLPNDGKRMGDKLFYQQYHYPLYANIDITEVLDRVLKPETREEDSLIVKQWYQKFYSPFDESAFLKLIK